MRKLPAIGDHLEIMGRGSSYFLVTGVVIPANVIGVLAPSSPELEVYARKISKDEAIKTLRREASALVEV